MSDQLEGWIESMLKAGVPAPAVTDSWMPAADVYCGDDLWLIKVDLAGVQPQDVTVSCRGNQLTISGKRRDRVTERGLKYYRMEISYSSFRRTLELPCDVESKQVSTQLSDGMLFIRVC